MKRLIFVVVGSLVALSLVAGIVLGGVTMLMGGGGETTTPTTTPTTDKQTSTPAQENQEATTNVVTGTPTPTSSPTPSPEPTPTATPTPEPTPTPNRMSSWGCPEDPGFSWRNCDWYEWRGAEQDDFLKNDYEEFIGTDPKDGDTDGDGIQDETEVAGSQKLGPRTDPSVATFEDTHPAERDLYIDIVYSPETDVRLSESEIDEIERLWDEELTPGETLHVHIRNGVPEADTSSATPGDGLSLKDLQGVQASYTGSADVERHMVYITPASVEQTGGSSIAGGNVAWVDEDYATSRIVVHETVHNIAGSWNPPCDTPGSHVCGDYLMSASTTGDLSDDVSDFTIQQLEGDWGQ